MIWAFFMYMNGYTMVVDTFATRAACEDKIRQYTAAFKQSGTDARVWCEEKPRV